MYKNPGKAIRGLAKFLCIVGIIFSILLGVGLILFTSSLNGVLNDLFNQYNLDVFGVEYAINPNVFSSGTGIITGIVIAVLGSVLAWLKYLLLAGIGTLIENSSEIRKMMEKSGAPAAAAVPVEAPAAPNTPVIAPAPFIPEEPVFIPQETVPEEAPAPEFVPVSEEVPVPAEAPTPEEAPAPEEVPASFVPEAFTEPEASVPAEEPSAPAEEPGTSDSLVCPKCGAEFPVGTKFCVYCGCKL